MADREGEEKKENSQHLSLVRAVQKCEVIILIFQSLSGAIHYDDKWLNSYSGTGQVKPRVCVLVPALSISFRKVE